MPKQINACRPQGLSGNENLQQQLLHNSGVRQPGGQLLSLVTPLTETGSAEDWRLLLIRLSSLVGNQGSAAIFAQSVHQITTQFPALTPLTPHPSWPEQLAQLQHGLQQLSPAAAAQARQSLWRYGSQLISRLLGVTLSTMLLQQDENEPGIHRYG